MSVSIQIHGATRLYAIVGDPIEQVKSPAVYSDRFAELGLPAIMFPLHVRAGDLEALVPQLETVRNLDGILVTSPHKISLAAHCRSLGPAAECVGAVNAMRRAPSGGWHGDLFDGVGFVAGARRQGIELKRRRVLQFGAGGVGSAIAYQLAVAGVASIRIADPMVERSQRLCTRMHDRFPGLDVTEAGGNSLEGVDMVINASTVGIGGSPGLPGPLPEFHPYMAVGEVNVTGQGTELIRRARDAGLLWCDGAHLHAGQLDAILAFFFDLPLQTA